MDWIQFYILNRNIQKLNGDIQQSDHFALSGSDIIASLIIIGISILIGILFLHWYNKHY